MQAARAAGKRPEEESEDVVLVCTLPPALQKRPLTPPALSPRPIHKTGRGSLSYGHREG